MRVRPELSNKLRLKNADSSAKGKRGTDFKEAMNATGHAVPPAPLAGPRKVSYRPKQAPHQPNIHSNMARVRAKEITTNQANRLAKQAPIINECAKKYGVPRELICAVILQESGGNVRARSHVGAQGLMQLMPATAKRFGVTNSYDPRQNIEGGTKYLRFLLDKFKGDYRLVLAGYNAGEHRVDQYGGIPPFTETRNYVPNVLAYADAIWQILHQPVNRVASVNLPPHARKV